MTEKGCFHGVVNVEVSWEGLRVKNALRTEHLRCFPVNRGNDCGGGQKQEVACLLF